MKKILFALLLPILTAASCAPSAENARETDRIPAIYPDYTDVTIPVNIAPLNFLLRGNVEAMTVEVAGETLSARTDNKAIFDETEWHRLLASHTGQTVSVRVCTQKDGKWTAYKPFRWTIAKDSIDPYLTYRLIEPDYEVWNHIVLQQRCMENFDTDDLANHQLQENRCMNCHITGNQNPNLSMLYVRGKGGGAILNQDGHLRKLNIRAGNATDSMVSSSVYYAFSPNGRYITFSTNVIIPAFHAKGSKRMEVYDAASDVYVADLKTHRILHSKLLADTAALETFPTFSPDGKFIYYCSAHTVNLPKDIRDLQYNLVRIPFDEHTGLLGMKADTILNGDIATRQARLHEKGVYDSEMTPVKHSVCHPKISPDGHYIVYTVADYGTFPIWHREADLQMMDLHTGQIDNLGIINSDKSDTYHSWSANSRWLCFASKRDDGLYGKPYFSYIDRQGKAHKPFVLPQRDPEMYDNLLKSFNVPELCKGKIPFDAVDVQKAMEKESEPFILVEKLIGK
ncbi:MAG: hypothetical protein K6A82_06475 [Prevotella sp.]|nr:hypothetical protein [Prevotella sp.]